MATSTYRKSEIFGCSRTHNANGIVAEGEPEQEGISETAQGDLCFTKSLVYSHALNHAPREPLKGLIYEREGEERCHPHIMLRRE